MAEPYLIVETPRGGDAGYRFLTSRFGLKEGELARLALAASHNSSGLDYLAISRPIVQHLRTGAVREGTERIILAGIEPARLLPEDRESLFAKLDDCFSLVDELMPTLSEGVSERTTVMVRNELTQWLEQNAPQTFTVPQHPAEPAPTTSAGGWLLFLGILGFMLVAIVFLLAQYPLQKTPVDQPPSPKPEEVDQPPSPKPEELVKELARDWNSGNYTPEVRNDIVEALWTAYDWDQRQKIPKASNEPLPISEVEEFAKTIFGQPREKRYFESPAVKDEEAFRSFINRHAEPLPDKLRELRVWLYEAWEQYDGLLKAAKAAKDILSRHAPKSDFANIIMGLPDLYKSDTGLGVDFRKPKTPLFNQQDVLSFRMLQHCGPFLQERGLGASGGEAEVQGPLSAADDITNLLVRLAKDQSGICSKLEDERKTVCDKIRDKSGLTDYDKAFGAYKALESFLNHLAEVPRPDPKDRPVNLRPNPNPGAVLLPINNNPQPPTTD